MSQSRLERLRDVMAEAGLDGLVIASPKNRRYLSGFTGSNGYLLVTAESAHLLTDFRYYDQAAHQAEGWQIERLQQGEKVGARLGALAAALGLQQLGYECEHVAVATWQTWQEEAPTVRWQGVRGLVERLRLVKDAVELAAIERAASVADAAFRQLLPHIKPGAYERDLALELEFHMRKAGAEAAGFDIIVASGARGALPHGVASDKPLAHGDLITFDFGARYDGYHSDTTRTVALGRVDDRQRRIYNLVLEAQEAALAAVRGGVSGRALDAVARERIAAAGYAEAFGHGLGHGVGLDIHEGPRLSKVSEDVLAPGMTVTIEPGVYISGWGGVRIEDLAVVEPDGVRVLTQIEKELIVL